MAAVIDDCKASYRLRACWFDDIADFDDAERADLMGALIDYHFGNAHEFTTRAAVVAWRNISRTWQKDESHDSGLRDVRAEAGRRGALARWQAQRQGAQDARGVGFSAVDDDEGDDIRGAEYPSQRAFVGAEEDCGGDDSLGGSSAVSSEIENGKSMAKNGKRIICHNRQMAKNGYKVISKKDENTPLCPPVGENGKSKKGKGCGGKIPPQECAPIADAQEGSGIAPSQGVAVIAPATDGGNHSDSVDDSPSDSAQSDAGSACADSPAVSVNTGDGIPPSPERPPKSRRSRGENVGGFAAPTLRAWQDHAEQIGWQAENKAKTLAEIAAAFYYWQKLGWRTGNRPIVDWRAACADAKLRADTKAGRVPAETLEEILRTGRPPQHWKLELAEMRGVSFEDFKGAKWGEYLASAEHGETITLLKRCLGYKENQELLM